MAALLVAACVVLTATAAGGQPLAAVAGSAAVAPRVAERDRLRGEAVALRDKGKLPEVVESLYLVTLSRPPRPEEVTEAQTWIAKAATPKEGAQDLLWSLLNSKEFLFNH